MLSTGGSNDTYDDHFLDVRGREMTKRAISIAVAESYDLSW
ncbi:MAG: hypothetical protein NTY19_15770 [Planctomycetota bacterium]|nr:hypothetical protein [Planctomycetota bacterium]